MAATARMEFRISPEHRALLERAAELTGEPVSAFARAAAEERAERVVREHDATTTVPPEFFDELMDALGRPPRSNEALARAAARRRELVDRD